MPESGDLQTGFLPDSDPEPKSRALRSVLARPQDLLNIEKAQRHCVAIESSWQKALNPWQISRRDSLSDFHRFQLPRSRPSLWRLSRSVACRVEAHTQREPHQVEVARLYPW